ncbi:hypothetical protein [uncultured Amnibacterium sp.]|uniref:hypothetical protein n=1 Tax=uncultured Amnibacterium sp. TaxID=1631851 RepID=UPI0035CA298C
MTDGRLFTRTELLGWSGTRPERDRSLLRPRRNVYLPGGEVPQDGRDRYLLLIRAAHRTLTGDRIYSHESATAVLGLPSLFGWPADVHLICERRSGGRSQLDVVRHCVGLEHVRPVLVDGMLVTSPGRTAFDIALTRSFEEAVVVADAAFRLYPDSRREFAELVDAYGRRRGFQKAADVLAFADPRSGSAGESWSRTEMYRLGFARPDLQVLVTTDGKDEFGDFGWPISRSLGEFDGEVKYREDRYRQGGDAVDVVIREKNRENRMRVRWPNIGRWDYSDIRRGRLAGILIAARVPRYTDWAGRRPSVARYSSPSRGG